MSAYLIANIGSDKPDGLSAFLNIMPEFLEKYEGKQISSKGKQIKYNGLNKYHQFLVLEFNSIANAKNFWESNESHPLELLRETSEISVSFIQ